MTPFHNSFDGPTLVSEIPGYRDLIMSQPHVLMQPKLAGWCGIANTVTRRIYTRKGYEITNMPHINVSLPTQNCPEWVHGEYYIHGRTEDEMQSLIKLGDARVQFHIFDVVSNESAERRQARVVDINTNDVIKIVPALPMHPDDIHGFYEACLADGYEGAIIRIEDYGYRHGRSPRIFKIKPGIEVI